MNPSQPNTLKVLAVLSPHETQVTGGLPSEAVAGILGPAGAEGDFEPNPVFAEFMQQVIRFFGPDDPGLCEAAREQGEGCVLVIDLRTPEGIMGNVPPEDIIGAFEVAGGRLGKYIASDFHQIVTKNGLVQLPPGLREVHHRELMRLRVAQDDSATT